MTPNIRTTEDFIRVVVEKGAETIKTLIDAARKEIQQLKTVLQREGVTLDDDTLKILVSKGMTPPIILKFGKEFNKYFPKAEQEKTLQFLQRMEPNIHTKQHYINKLLEIGIENIGGFKEFIQIVQNISEVTGREPSNIILLLQSGLQPEEIIQKFTSSMDTGKVGEEKKPKQQQSTILNQSIIAFLRKDIGLDDERIKMFAEDDKKFGFKKMFQEARQTFPHINSQNEFIKFLFENTPEMLVKLLEERKASIERMCKLINVYETPDQAEAIRMIKSFYKQGMDQSTIFKRLRQTPKQRRQRQRRGGGMISPTQTVQQQTGGGGMISPTQTVQQQTGGGVQQSKTAR